MKKSLIGIGLALAISGCAGVKLPPIAIALPPPAAPAQPAEPSPPRATVAFEVLDDATGAPIPIAIATFEDGTKHQANDAGYIAVEKNLDIYQVTISAEDYVSVKRDVVLTGNRQFPIRLTSTKPKPVPLPSPPHTPVPEPTPVQTPAPVPVPVPQAHPAPVSCVEIECVRLTAQRFPRLLQINTYASGVEFVQRALELLGPDWGHVGKTAGEGQGVPTGFTPIEATGSDGARYRITGVSYDAIKHRLTGQVIDIVGAGGARSLADRSKHQDAGVTWIVVPPEDWRPNNPFIPAVKVQ